MKKQFIGFQIEKYVEQNNRHQFGLAKKKSISIRHLKMIENILSGKKIFI